MTMKIKLFPFYTSNTLLVRKIYKNGLDIDVDNDQVRDSTGL